MVQQSPTSDRSKTPLNIPRDLQQLQQARYGWLTACVAMPRSLSQCDAIKNACKRNLVRLRPLRSVDLRSRFSDCEEGKNVNRHLTVLALTCTISIVACNSEVARDTAEPPLNDEPVSVSELQLGLANQWTAEGPGPI